MVDKDVKVYINIPGSAAPICADCKHFRQYYCGLYPEDLDLVTGDQNYRRAYSERNPELAKSSRGCGAEGKMFEPKASKAFWAKVWNIMRGRLHG
jgi:hypothetical protein